MSAPRDECRFNLGALKHDFRVTRGALVMHMIVVHLAAVLLGGAVWKNWDQLIAPKDASVLMLYLVLAAVVVGIGWGTAAIVRFIRGSDLRLLLYTDGFACHRAGQWTTCRWDEVDVVRQDISGAGVVHAPVNYRRLSIRSRAGAEWVFDQRRDLLENFPKLILLVEAEVGRRHLPLALYDLRIGRTINCGPCN